MSPSFDPLANPRRARVHRFRRVIGVVAGLVIVSWGLWILFGRPKSAADAHDTLRVMTYSSFMNAWGPGPEIAKRFRDATGVTVEFQDAGDAGLIIEKLKLFPVDAVVGLDGLSLASAREHLQWKANPGERSAKALTTDGGTPAAKSAAGAGDTGDAVTGEPFFVAIDWAPLAFVYRKGEVEPPTKLDDLLDARFNGQIALEDPRTSTPGLQFLLWVLDVYGEDDGFQFLARLKPNLHSVSPSWSTAYGAFTKKQAKLALSYLTSPIYHLLEEKDPSYSAAVFVDGQPVQTEYAGIPAQCARCSDADKFIQFLLKPEIQALIMKKNFMMPVVSESAVGTPFAALGPFHRRDLKSAPEFLKRRNELFEKWRKLGL